MVRVCAHCGSVRDSLASPAEATQLYVAICYKFVGKLMHELASSSYIELEQFTSSFQ